MPSGFKRKICGEIEVAAE
jgi:hypothetical protein